MTHPPKTNPWLEIPPEDYEGHMSDAAVAQLQFLDNVFSETIAGYDAASIALLGCATGNGLAHVDGRITRRVTAVDIHPGYLEVLRSRYAGKVAGLETVEGDLTVCELENDAYSLIFAGLLFEYLEPAPLLKKIVRWLQPDGVLLAVLQLPAHHNTNITNTRYTSLQGLEPIMQLVAPADLTAAARQAGLNQLKSHRVVLASGKPFQISVWKKSARNHPQVFERNKNTAHV